MVGSSSFFWTREDHTESSTSFVNSPLSEDESFSITSLTLASLAVNRKWVIGSVSGSLLIRSIKSCLAEVSDWRYVR